MIDRLQFDVQRLANGIECYTNPLKLDYTTVLIQIPRGTAHNTQGVLGGTYHFLEHVCCSKSKAHPQKDGFEYAVGIVGGHSNAVTKSFVTEYYFSAPNAHLAPLLDGLYSRVFEPLIEDADLDNHRDVIANERQRSARWWPGNSEIDWYLQTQWGSDERFSIEQLFGSDSDLAGHTTSSLKKAHRQYFTEGIRLVAIGPGDLSPLLKKLGALSLSPHQSSTAYALSGWHDKSYRVQRFRDASRYILKYGGLVQPAPDRRTSRQWTFLLRYLTNNTHGVLHRWLRQELGWSYGISYSSYTNWYEMGWILNLPVSTLDQVEQIRQQWRGKVEAALNDQMAIDQEVERIIGASTYWHEGPSDVFNDAIDDLGIYGEIIPDEEWRDHIRSCHDIAALQRLYKEYMNEETIGSICIAPEV